MKARRKISQGEHKEFLDRTTGFFSHESARILDADTYGINCRRFLKTNLTGIAVLGNGHP